MIEDCLQAERPLAVCGTRRLLERTQREDEMPRPDPSGPPPVVSYGSIGGVERLADGRLLVEADMVSRGRIESLVENGPYYLAELSPMSDADSPPSAAQALLRAEIGARFESLWNAVNTNQPPLRLDALGFGDFTFRILGFLQTDPVLAQLLLEETDPERRACVLLDILYSIETRLSH